MSQLLGELGNICDHEKLHMALHAAGCRSAFQFFQDFLPLLANERQLFIPETEIEFLRNLAKFDLRSSWWTKPPEFLMEGRFLSVVLHHPFTAFPWHESNPYSFNQFIVSYVLTLFNCAADFLCVIDTHRGARHNSAFCLAAVDLEQAPSERLYMRLYISSKYVTGWKVLDTVLFRKWQDDLVGRAHQEADLLRLYDYYGYLVSKLEEVFDEGLEFSRDWDVEMERRRKQQPPRGHETTATSILLDLRFKYQELRTKRLLEIDEGLRSLIEQDNESID